jgi:hypothetical protein
MISFMFSASTSREFQKLALDVFQLSSASMLVLLVVRDAPASYSGTVATKCATILLETSTIWGTYVASREKTKTLFLHLSSPKETKKDGNISS